MTKTLYISDLDGTLLDRHSLITESTRNRLNRLIAAGADFSIATARTPATVARLMDGIDIRLPMVVMTGAAMWDGHSLINRRYLLRKEVECLSELCRQHGIRPFLYTFNGKSIDTYHCPLLDDYEQEFVRQRHGSPFKRFVMDDCVPEQRRDKVLLLFATGGYEQMGVVHEAARRRLSCSMTCYRDVFNPEVGFLEVMAQGVSKAEAVASLARQTGAGRVVVFGDSPNDLSMRAVADRFVAPSNASDEVLKVADEVIGSHDEDSVVNWIEADFFHRAQ